MPRPLLALGLLAVFNAVAPAADPPAVVDLWPGVAPGETGDVPPEAFEPVNPKEKPPIPRLKNVSKPTLTVYRPTAAANTGAAVVIAPGGGYSILAWEHEGTQVAEWLSSIGVTGIVLKYRVPRRPDQPKDAPPVAALQDAQRAVSLVRSRAAGWGIDPARIGMLGFSAGGHLTTWAGTNSDKRAYDAADAVDRVSCRPDFAVLIYPSYLTAQWSRTKLQPELRVAKDAPPCFIAVAYNDDACVAGSLALFDALKASKVPAELHVYGTGGHGFGMLPGDRPAAAWPKRAEEWMKAQGLLGAKKP